MMTFSTTNRNFFIRTVSAANPDTINISIRIKSVGLMINKSAWHIGWVETSSTSTTDGGANWSCVENTGNYPGDFHILCENSTSWTLADSAGVDTFAFSISTWGTNGSHNGTWHSLDDWQDNDTFATNVDGGANVSLGLRFFAPTYTEVATEEQFDLTLSMVLV